MPSLNGQVDRQASKKEKEVPTPSPAIFTTKRSDDSSKMAKPAALYWSPALLDHFVQSFLLPLRKSRLYALSLTFSGPKPDPFIALPAPPPLASHQHTVRYIPASPARPTSPVRAEAGDHMRVYCDAREALSLRTWLHGVAVDPRSLDGEAGKSYRLFDKVRLVLMGERGEVLIVA